MISQTAEYALRAMVFLAENAEEALPVPIIAEHTRVPAGYLSKVLQGLVRSGLVESRRGLRGGFRLARGPADLNLLEIVNSVSPIERITTCPLGLPYHEGRLCSLHQRLDEAIGHFERSFRETTLADLMAEQAGKTFNRD
ncbi:MAG: Rrf2 family transcriptional regulator [bacterium]|jgi:Rrf2 family protein|nr:Rrf2 family transcriptional regulator [bacterium]